MAESNEMGVGTLAFGFGTRNKVGNPDIGDAVSLAGSGSCARMPDSQRYRWFGQSLSSISGINSFHSALPL